MHISTEPAQFQTGEPFSPEHTNAQVEMIKCFLPLHIFPITRTFKLTLVHVLSAPSWVTLSVSTMMMMTTTRCSHSTLNGDTLSIWSVKWTCLFSAVYSGARSRPKTTPANCRGCTDSVRTFFTFIFIDFLWVITFFIFMG